MIHYLVSMDGLEEIEAALGKTKDKTKQVLKSAINSSAKELEQKMASLASKRYARKERGMKPYRAKTTITKATVGNGSAIITVKSGPIDLYKYKISDYTVYPGGKGAPRWLKGEQLRAGQMHKLALKPDAQGDKYKAFTVQFKNGHRAVVERVPGSHMKKKPEKEALKALYATTEAKAEEFVFHSGMENDINRILLKNIEAQLERYL